MDPGEATRGDPAGQLEVHCLPVVKPEQEEMHALPWRNGQFALSETDSQIT